MSITLADEIRKSYRLTDKFIEETIVPPLKKCGRAFIICDHHIGEICNYAIPFRYGNSLEEWARNNGFNVRHYCNSYGVKHIEITI